jgi:pimeloyl-ACP methyl ester carboxylesterase
MTVQQGAEEFNQFDVIHLKSAGGKHEAPVVLIAPFGFPAEFWEQSDDGSYADAFAPAVALSGRDVWLVDSRLAAAAPGQCESGVVDCSPMRDWGVETAVSDALFVTRLARSGCGGKKPVIGGLSGGSATALAAVNQRPELFSGLFLWEGTLVSDDPDIRARNAAFCEADEDAWNSGVYYDGSVQVFQLLFSLASADPEGLSPIPVFPPGTTNLQALLFALSFPDPNNPLNFTEDFVRFVGDPFTSSLFYSEIPRVLGLGGLVGNYAPIAFIRDTHCSIGGSETRFTDRLDRFRGEVLIFAEGRGFNTMMLDTGARMTRADVTVDYQPDFGESDRFFHVDWRTVALDPFLTWLD